MTLEHLKNFIKARLAEDCSGAADGAGHDARESETGLEERAGLADGAGGEPLCIAVGAIDANRERCIGVYPGKPPARQRVCLGGAQATLTGDLYATVLVHWGKNMREAMEKAAEVYALFSAWGRGGAQGEAGGLSGSGAPNRRGIEMDGVRVYAVEPGGGPVPVGRDAHGVCEFVINLKITFEKGCM